MLSGAFLTEATRDAEATHILPLRQNVTQGPLCVLSPEARAQRAGENTHLCDQPCVLAGALLWLPPEILTAASTPLSSLDA
jgi:hypothetical protein